MPKTSLFLYSFSFILSLVFKASLNFSWPIFVSIFLIILLIFNLRKHKSSRVFLALLIFTLTLFYNFENSDDYLKNTKDKLGRQNLDVWICKEPVSKENTQELVLCPVNSDFNFKIISWWPLYPQFSYGKNLIINCDLKLPEKIDDFDYQKFLAREGIYYTCSFPRIVDRKEAKKGSRFLSYIYDFKQNIYKLVKRNLPEPNAGLVLAMLLGDRQKVSEEVGDDFRHSGIAHLTAVSGTHINLISFFLLLLLISFGLKKKMACWPLLVLLSLYVVLVGARASAFRALLMSLLALMAWRNNRLVHPLSTLSVCASISLLINPESLFDIGWQLSFMAVLGIMLFMPSFNSLNEKIISRVYPKLRKFIRPFFLAFFLSLSVQIMIWPILVGHFNYISLVSVFSNVLIFPVFSLLMFWLFPTLILSSIFKVLAWFLFSPIYYLSSYLINVAEFMSSFSSFYLQVESIGYMSVFIYYGAIFLIYRYIKKQSLF